MINFKKKRINYYLIISNFFSLILVICYDILLHPKYNIKINQIKYWMWLISWWSAWTSFLTIFWSIYNLFKSRQNNYYEELINLIIFESNLLSFLIFFLGGFKITIPRKNRTIIIPFLGTVKAIYFYFFYNFFWHLLSPCLFIWKFIKKDKINKLKNKKTKTILLNLLNPIIYFFYVCVRPHSNLNQKKIFKNSQPWNFPSDYPYFFFYWCFGKEAFAGQNDKKWVFWKNWSKKKTIFFWVTFTHLFSYIVFTLIILLIFKIKTCKKKIKKQ